VWLEAKGRTGQKITLPNIDAVIRKEEAKHGNKSIEYRVINALRAKGYNDIAVYTGIALAQTNLLPNWSLDDIVNEIDNRTHLDKKFHKYLNGKSRGTPIEQKKIAMTLWQNIIENEGQRKIRLKDEEGNEVEIKTDEIVNTIKDKNTVLAHEISASGKMQHIETAILNALDFFAKLEGVDPNYRFDRRKYYNFRPDEYFTTTQYLNNIIGRGIQSSNGAVPIPQEIQKILSTYEFDENVEKFLNDIVKTLSGVNKNIMWPESDFAIENYSDLKKYFKLLHSSEEQTRGNKIIKMYKKKGQEVEKEQAGGIDSKIYEKLIDHALNKISGLNASVEPDKTHDEFKKVAKELVDEHPTLVSYVTKVEKLGDDFTSYEHNKEAVIDELTSILAFKKSISDRALGRKRKSLKE